eukprot:CAMPEP_0168363932 /NCGR_PEP_ID=MMETSP0228-20121227/3948_1 /TAXON_ID=133427 /ORGANISM="Protoceratium reticulatum, Strain CCCM 535 (=CCMP 1889)" /LENGTH=382 /DNA_ID=CAMNT_0008376679 /DNA_START=27 /DNA_END=1173 /DNA_ORIENTATION=-
MRPWLIATLAACAARPGEGLVTTSELAALEEGKEAVVVPILKLDECVSKRLFALVRSVGQGRDVVVLYEPTMTNPHGRYLLERHGVQFKPQQVLPADSSLATFGGTRSLGTKPAFLLWAAKNTKKYRFFWHVEDDVFFTGPWHGFFDGYRISKADLLARLSDLSDPASANWLNSCQTDSNVQCIEHFKHKVSWPVLRMSNRLVQTLVEGLSDKGASGHHEVLTGSMCWSQDWCKVENIMGGFHQDKFGVYELAGWGEYKAPNYYNDSSKCGKWCQSRQVMQGEDGYYVGDGGGLCGSKCCSLHKIALSTGLGMPFELPVNKLYHPVKCRPDLCGDQAAGEEALSRCLGNKGTRLWHKEQKGMATQEEREPAGASPAAEERHA